MSPKKSGFGKHLDAWLTVIFNFFLGTPTYVAPEILAERGYGFEVDNWAAGVICYILLCGFPPFRNKGTEEENARMNSDDLQEELFSQIQHADYEFLSPYWDEVSDSAMDLVRRLLVVNRNHRTNSVGILTHPWIQMYTNEFKNNVARPITSHKNYENLNNSIDNLNTTTASTSSLNSNSMTTYQANANYSQHYFNHQDQQHHPHSQHHQHSTTHHTEQYDPDTEGNESYHPATSNMTRSNLTDFSDINTISSLGNSIGDGSSLQYRVEEISDSESESLDESLTESTEEIVIPRENEDVERVYVDV